MDSELSISGRPMRRPVARVLTTLHRCVFRVWLLAVASLPAGCMEIRVESSLALLDWTLTAEAQMALATLLIPAKEFYSAASLAAASKNKVESEFECAAVSRPTDTTLSYRFDNCVVPGENFPLSGEINADFIDGEYKKKNDFRFASARIVGKGIKINGAVLDLEGDMGPDDSIDGVEVDYYIKFSGTASSGDPIEGQSSCEGKYDAQERCLTFQESGRYYQPSYYLFDGKKFLVTTPVKNHSTPESRTFKRCAGRCPAAGQFSGDQEEEGHYPLDITFNGTESVELASITWDLGTITMECSP